AEAVLDATASRRDGLAGDDAARRLREAGPNAPAARKDDPWYKELLEEFTEPLILLLIAVGVIYAFLGEPSDAIVIVVVILITIGAEFATEWRAKRAIAALASLREPTAPVLRDGEIATIPVETIVPGDVVILTAGDRVPADVRLLSTSALAADESILSGESMASEKRADAVVPADAPLAERSTMTYGGTVVTRGDGVGVVVATGSTTETARISHLVSTTGPRRTQLQLEMGRLAGTLLWVALAASVLAPVLMVVIANASWREALLSGLTLAFATIPEELPLLITSVLALGSFRLARRHAVVRNLQAAESLGAVSVLVSDKTGTLTENRMTVDAVVDAAGAPHALAADDPLVRRAIGIGILANDAVSAQWGDPTDRAFLAAGTMLGGDAESWRSAQPNVTVFPFSDETRSVVAVSRHGDGARIAVKGAPESVLARCARVATPDGDVALDVTGRAAILGQAERLAGDGARVLLVADREAALPADAPRPLAETDLTCVALVILRDPVRASAGPAVSELSEAGVQVVMITGDHPATAAAIARELELGSGTAVTEAELPARAAGDAGANALAPFVLRHPVVARATPEGKFRIVEALEESGERVAVIGDGINDAPALARATVGVAMGLAGTDVAREASDLVLTDDNFATVVLAVREGRHLYDNLRKA
ncbi:MAG: cation-transporting P-type ATPase, partial [Thermomicrobiales bacterium]